MISGRKITAFTKKISNLGDEPGLATTADLKQWFDSSPEELRVAHNGLVDDLSSVTAGASGAEQIGSAPIVGVTGSTPHAQIADVKSQLSGLVLGQVPDGTLTQAKFAPEVSGVFPQVAHLQGIQANLVAMAEIDAQSVPNSGYVYDLFRGSSLNLYSAGAIDLFQSNVTAALAAGATTAALKSATGLSVGREVTFQDVATETKRERVIVTAIAGNDITFSPALANAYVNESCVYRSLGAIDTANKRLGFGGALYTHTQANTNVVASAYDTSGSGGRKVVRLRNGWLVSTAYSANVHYLYVSKDNGATWAQLCTVSNAATYLVGSTIASVGNKVYLAVAYNNTHIYTFVIDAETQTNVNIHGTQLAIDSAQTAAAAPSYAVNAAGTELHASWASKNATYPNSFNIRYAKGTIAANGTVTWAAATQITTLNTASIDYINPCIVARSNGNPTIIAQYNDAETTSTAGTEKHIEAFNWSGTAWSAAVIIYNGTTYLQGPPSAVVSPDGTMHVVWHGPDATDTAAHNIRYSKSTDGVTWSAMLKLTTGNTYSQQLPSIAADKNNSLYVLWFGLDSVISTTYYNIRKIVFSGSAWGPVTTLTNNTTANAMLPATCANYTNFTDPLAVWQDNQAPSVKFRGTWVGSFPVLQEDIRYNITPPTGLVDELRSWIQYDDFAGFTVTAAVSMVDSAANESFVAMEATTSDLGAMKETYFNGFVAAVEEKCAQRITMNRASTSDDKALSKYLAAVIA